ncbi:helix-turn-helix domain-containing protein [Conexibacter stalactiti]|uniref:Helix-turn-helix domain-containing protein n=1 Tax=Conexibacter stalactiti TaxID=1940611 RepID=A0ABU4HRL9_9ACTN|nr:helix-turn-helix domain-containing protein [Conexibacter stalactiti]MDW5595945.1 helix-turn-helix domain-containing protein [Conexibacter stalactiti]MEC5036587.1 helix-turn-helix domain-containing protein [Conexibacter stalactiti]
MSERPEPRRRGRPARLTQAEIVRAARELLEREGVAALTMRGVARAVGSTPMGLYHHVADKDELLLLLLEAEAAALKPPPLPDDPRARIVVIARFIRDVLDARPWVLEAITPGLRFGRASLPLVEQIIAGFVACGLEPDDAARAYRALWYLITGELNVRHAAGRANARGTRAGRPAEAEAEAASGFAVETMASLDADELPLLAGIGARWWEVADAYDAGDGLAALVDGLVARHGRQAGEG